MTGTITNDPQSGDAPSLFSHGADLKKSFGADVGVFPIIPSFLGE
jgi:hypothetical protein